MYYMSVTICFESRKENMMKIKNFVVKNIVTCMNALALLLVVQNANSACVWLMHQPEFPQEAEKFKKD